MVQKANKQTGIKTNWVEHSSTLARRLEARKKNKVAKQQEIGKQYIRVPHPTLKNTFILKEKV